MPSKSTSPKHSLLSVLDWGLGHASRCIPLARRLLAEGDQVTVASSGHALAFLRAACAGMDFLELPAYGIRYPSSSMVWNMSWQGPRVLQTIWREQKRIQAWAKETSVDRIISDGRFGCYAPGVENIWLAHQLHIQHPNRLLAKALNIGYHRFIRQRFAAVWVPDYEQERSLAGALSQPIAGLPTTYLGPLSRFAEAPKEEITVNYRYLALLSGPEPQRTYLEAEIRALFAKLDQPSLLVRGVPGSTEIRQADGLLHEVDWLYGPALQAAVAQSQQLICRSGYSTLMDLHFWQKPAIFIPTPGQTEQLYLADYWAQRGWGSRQEQGEIRL